MAARPLQFDEPVRIRRVQPGERDCKLLPGLARRPTTRQRHRDELAMTLTLVVGGLVLAPPTGWLLAAWLADLT